MFTLYHTLLFVHILAAIIWVGGALAVQVLAARAQRNEAPEVLARFAEEASWIGQHVFLPAAIVLFAAGAWMVVLSWSFTDTWVAVAVVLWIASALTGSIFLGPESERIGKLIAEKGPSEPEVRSRIGRILLVSRIELLAFLVIVVMMVFKPGS